jgi:hypothetical protein
MAMPPRDRNDLLSYAGDVHHLLGMKLVFSAPNPAQISLAQSLLEAAGIACEVRNEAVSQVIPGFPFATELWVLREEDYKEARRLCLSVMAPPTAPD